MKLSVIMATYNGEKYIFEQLNSIRKQTVQADEVIICDDVSTDNTVKIIRGFIEKYELKNWLLKLNNKNLGWEKNFISLMKIAKGDIIFYADQDDIWVKEKIRIMSAAMLENNNILCLAGKLSGIDSTGQYLDVLKFSAFERYRSDESGMVQQIRFDRGFMNKYFAGCVLAFRREIVEYICKIGILDSLPDRQICRIANVLNGLFLIDKNVIQHRFHHGNAGGSIDELNGSGTIERRTSEIEKDLSWIVQTTRFFKNTVNDDVYMQLNVGINLCRYRLSFIKNFNWFSVIKFLIRSGENWKEILGDICYKININKFAGKIYFYIKS